LLSFFIHFIRKLAHPGISLALAGCCVLHCAGTNAQNQDSAAVKQQVHRHSARKATLYSAIVPGLGQVYNQKYWKVPIIYGAGGAFGYYVGYNQLKYKKFRDANEAYQLDKTDGITIIDGISVPNSRLEAGMNYYRRYRDLSVLGVGAIYLLNIVDAMIDANFFYYDVSDDLSLQIQPVIMENTDMTATLGVGIRIGF